MSSLSRAAAFLLLFSSLIFGIIWGQSEDFVQPAPQQHNYGTRSARYTTSGEYCLNVWTTVPVYDGQWPPSIVMTYDYPVVDCGVVGATFQEDFRGYHCFPDFPQLQFVWWLSPVPPAGNVSEVPSDVYFAEDELHVLKLWDAVEGSQQDIRSFFTVSGLEDTSVVPSEDYPGEFSISMTCMENALVAASVGISFSMPSLEPTLPSSTFFSAKWRCLPPKCTPACELHGSCIVGTCFCDDGWHGTSCEIFIAVNLLLCPGDEIVFNYSIPMEIDGIPGAGNLLSYVIASEWLIDQRYFLTWSITTPYQIAPNWNQNYSGIGISPAFLSPGVYLMNLLSSSGTVFETLWFEVFGWEECGYYDAVCGSGYSNDCNLDSSRGYCDSTYGECNCFSGSFWYDCSRGCPDETVHLTNSSAEVWSDYPVSHLYSDTRLVIQSHCSWLIEPANDYDEIIISFPYFKLESGTLTLETTEGELIGSVSGDSPAPFIVGKVKVFIQLDTIRSSYGFVFNYTTRQVPLSAVAKAFIGVASIFVGVCITAGACVVALCIARHFRKRAEFLNNLQAETLEPLSPQQIEEFVASSSSLDHLGIQIDKTRIRFGLEDGASCSIGSELYEDLEIENRSGGMIAYSLFAPTQQKGLSIKITPGRGIIPSHTAVTISIEATMNFTTHFFNVLRIDAYNVMVFRGIYRSQSVAVKIPNHQEGYGEAEMRHFENECALMKHLKHPCIISFIGASHVRGKLCILTELAEKGTLSDFLESSASISYFLLIKFALDIAQAMGFLHENKIMFRDLKCSNVLLVSTSEQSPVCCKLTDFGSARTVEDTDFLSSYTRVGTFIYMAPEVITASPYNSKADTFNFGMLLWEMFARKKPWLGLIIWDIAKKVSKGERPEFSSQFPDCVVKLIQKCWAQSHTERPTFYQIINTLGGIRDSISPSGCVLPHDNSPTTVRSNKLRDCVVDSSSKGKEKSDRSDDEGVEMEVLNTHGR
ncbi:serine/threonine-protein kinase STY17 [Pelomyxa schiedti]|nr:serine/threonine-protein kinase STY17 [Pelomyxa schiedti]